MDQMKQEQPVKQEATETQANGVNQNHANQTVSLSHPPIFHLPRASPFSSYPNRDPFQQASFNYIIQQQKRQELEKKLSAFWANQKEELEQTDDFKTDSIPLARIRRIMKREADVNMISAEGPILIAKACEMFIKELTMRSSANTDINLRKTLQKSDVASAIANTDLFDFLAHIAPKEDTMEQDIFLGTPRPVVYVPIRNEHYCYVPNSRQPQYAAGPSYGPPPPTMLMGRPVLNQPYINGQLPYPFANPRLPVPKQENDPSTDLPDSEN